MNTLKRARGASLGISLIEIMVAMCVIVVAMIGLIFVISHSTRQNQINREVAVAQRAAQAVLERMSSRNFEDIFKMFNENPTDGLGDAWYVDPLASPGLENYLSHQQPGPFFPVEQDPVSRRQVLRPLDTATQMDVSKEGMCGRVWFPAVYDKGTGTEPLLEDPKDPNGDWRYHFLFPRDLDGDGVVSSGTDFSSSYRILPVIVTVTWQGLQGQQTLTLRHLFISRKTS